MSGQYADLPGARLWYIDTGGDGVPVVFLHAGTGSSRVWEYQIPPFTKAGYRVIAYDRRGYGRTTVTSPDDSVGSSADDLRALMDHLRIERFHLVGTAAGGGVALDFALSYPERLRSLVVANSVGDVRDSSYAVIGRALWTPEFRALPPELRELGPSYRAASPEGARRWLELEHLSRAPGTPVRSRPSRNRITFARLETIRVPTLLVTGDADLYTPPAVLRLFAARMRHADTLMVREAGHSTYWEQPDVFNRAVLGFLRDK